MTEKTNKEKLQEVKREIEVNGLDILNGLNCTDIDNKTFQRLLEAYRKASERVEKYIYKHSKD